MIINTAGEYTLQYTATDACGNTTTVERDLVVEGPPRTVLYTDGTFIINERSIDIEANIAAHGQPTNVYAPFDPNGNTDVKKYIFSSYPERPWDSQVSSVRSVEVGSSIQPTSTAYWFYNMRNCTSIDFAGLDTSAVTNMSNMFCDCRVLTSLDVSNFNTSAVTDMHYMFNNCYALTSLDVSNFNTSAVTDMSYMFGYCQAITTLDLSNFDTSAVTNMYCMFAQCRLLGSVNLSSFDTSLVTNMGYMFNFCQAITTLDLSSFDTSIVKEMNFMFNNCQALTTIYVSSLFVVTQVTQSLKMFQDTRNIVGCAGTTWDGNNPQDKTYARIDNPPSAPGYFTARP